MNAAASAWEFRYRFWIYGAWFWISFSAFRLDHKNFGNAVVEMICALLHREPTIGDLRIVFFVGAILAMLSAALRTWATAYIRSEVMADSVLHTHTVVAEGPYRFVRNPLYLGTNLLVLGYSVMASRLGALLLIAGIFVFNYRIILHEERELLMAQGRDYERYLREVPRLWPSLQTSVDGSGHKPSWGSGLLGEMFIWGLALALFIFAITFNIRLYFLALGLSFGVCFLCLGIIGKLKQNRR